MHRTQFGKNPPDGQNARFVRSCAVLICNSVWNARWPDRGLSTSDSAAALSARAVTNHPKSSLHRRQQRQQKRCDSNPRKVTAAVSENS
jgi:hypothetical protein